MFTEKRLSDEEVRNELIKCAGAQFDPALTDAFVRLIDRKELQVSTENGMATDERGITLISAKLENRLQSDLLQKKQINNPTHVRMMCYVIKLMEKKNKNISVLFYGPNKSVYNAEEKLDNAWNDINSFTKTYMKGQDIIVRYDCDLNVLALFDRDEDEIKVFVQNFMDNNKDSIVFDIDNKYY